MNFKICIEANEIEQVDELSSYNNIVWKLARPTLGLTHFKEVYDDVSEYPVYHFGIIENNRFKSILQGDGDPIPLDKIGVGGVWVEITILNIGNLLFQANEKADKFAEDSARWQYVVRNHSWIRHQGSEDPEDVYFDPPYAEMAVRLPFDADLSSVGSATDAIDKARKAK